MAKKKSSKESPPVKPNDDISSRLYEWIADGYTVEPLVAAVKSKDAYTIEKLFRQFEANIARMEELKILLIKRGYDENNPKYKGISLILKDPSKVKEIENFVISLEAGPRMKVLYAELASLNTKGFEKEAAAVKAKLADPKRIDEAERDLKALTRRIKERFFEDALEDVVVPTEKDFKCVAETIFLMHKDGTLLAVKSKRPPAELNKKLLSRMVMAIREQMARAYKEGEHLHTLIYEGHSIILEDSVHVYAAVVVRGQAKPIMYRIILKALQIMERNLNQQFSRWRGDRAALDNLDKYTTAIFQAFEKMG